MTTTFEQSQTTDIINNGFTFDVYLWSTAANWTNGVPGAGAVVTHNITVAGNPSGYDNIASLYLDSLAVNAGQVAVGGSLEIGVLSFGTANFPSVFSDTLLGSSAATLVVDGFGGSNYGEIGAFGTNALTVIQSATDTGGETYQVDDGGELVLDPTPQYNSSISGAGYFYENSVATGTFAFRDPGGTISAPLDGVAIGDSIALPGTGVSSVTYAASSIVIVTNVGTTTFSNVGYSGTHPTGYTVSTDPTGLQRITFASQQDTSFRQAQTTEIINNGFTFGVYLWSTAANWTNGIPDAGAAVTHNITVAGNPSGYDDIAGLYLDSLAVTAGQIAVGGSLEIGALSFGTANFPSVFSDTLLGSSAATLVVDGFTGSNYGEIGAFGTNALTLIQSATDTGSETYQVDDGGELVLDPTPQYNSSITSAGYFYENSVATGTFAFRNPGGTISAPLDGVAIGDSIALPGSIVYAVAYGTTSISVLTNLGTTIFSNVSYSGTTPSSFIVSSDPISGLERITFGSLVSTSFTQVATGTVGSSSEYLWSNSGNWTNGVPGNGDAVTFNIAAGTSLNPSAYDDIGSLYLDTLNVQHGYVAVGGTLDVARLGFSETPTGGVIADTLINGGTASVTIAAINNGSRGLIEAEGSHAVIAMLGTADRGEIYKAAYGGEVIVAPAPLSSAQLDLNLGDVATDTGTIALLNPGPTVAALLGNVGIADAIELPGSLVSSVTFGSSTLTVTTNLGTTEFTDVTYLSGSTPAGFVASPDATTGLEEITFTLCFCRGTLIRTPHGDVPVEQLAVGDSVVTWRGDVREIAWIGVGQVLATRGTRNAATPVIVRKGALADNVPFADLHVTKGHSLWIDEALIPVEFLVNHRSVLWDDRAQEVSIFHVELATHDVLIANGAPAESYRDDGNRWLFRNANEGWNQPPKPPCAPVLTGGTAVDRVWKRLLHRAGQRPGVPLTSDPDLHLMVDGARIDSRRIRDDVHEFALPACAQRIWLLSRAASPQELGIARDPRLLGVAIRRMLAMQAARMWVLEADDARLDHGFHEFEADLGIRWTDGEAVISACLHQDMIGPGTLRVVLGGTTQYLDSGEIHSMAA